MKTNNQQELKPLYIQEASYSNDDDINLVDLAVVLVQRKVLIASVFLVFVAMGVTTAMLTTTKTKTYSFRTTIEIGSQLTAGTNKPLEAPQAFLSQLQYKHIPQLLIEYKQANPNESNKYQIKPSIPTGSNFLLLEIKGTENQTDAITDLLQRVTLKVIQSHSRIYTSLESSLKTRISQTTLSLRASKNDAKELEKNKNLIISLTNQLENLQNTQEVMPITKSLDPNIDNRKKIIIAFAISGLFIGVFSAYFSNFLSKIKQKIREKNKA